MSNKVTVDSILWAYRLLLNREPENLDIVKDKLNRLTNNQELVKELINSPEFALQQQDLCSGLLRDLLGNALEVLGQKIKTTNNYSPAMVDRLLDSADRPNMPAATPQNQPQVKVAGGKVEKLVQQGDVASQQKQYKDAAVHYQKAIENNPNIREEVYLKLIAARQRLKQENKAQRIYKKWIEREYLFDREHKFIYCPIAKNACTLFKNVLIKISDRRENYEHSGLKIHEYIDQNRQDFILDRFTYLEQKDYFKFIILRNPFKRIVSTYGDKFVKRLDHRDPHAVPVIREVYQHLGKEVDFEKSITFSQFVDYLMRTEDCNLDSHWRPQSIYFAPGLVKFDYVGQFERLDTVIKHIEQKLDIKIDAAVSTHRINYANVQGDRKYHDWYPHQLNQLDHFPTSSEFYTPELEAKIAHKYAQDIAIYEEEFNTTLSALT